jgi:suppressor of fused
MLRSYLPRLLLLRLLVLPLYARTVGIFDKFKKKSGDDRRVVTQTVEFTVGPDIREVDDGGVKALDNALKKVGSGELLHHVDPRRINAFSSGGPATWSVAFVPIGNDHFFVTYGNSDRIEPARSGVDFELSIRVPARSGGLWPGLLLRQLVRYMLKSRRELRVSDFMPLPTPITRVAGGADDPAKFPPTNMDAVFLVPDPLLPTVDAPRGRIEVRRVVGMFPDERELMEPWSVRGLADVMRKWSPELTTDIERASFSTDRAFIDAMAEGSRKEGSQFGFVAVPGVAWEATDSECRITLPGGRDALRIHRMIEARLHHGRNLLIHDIDPEQRLAIALEPSQEWNLAIQDNVVVLHIPLDAPHLKALANPPEGNIVWKLS